MVGLATRKLPSATASAQTTPAAQANTVTTATLVRGKVYVYKGVHYKKDIPVVVDDATALLLEDLYELVTDADHEEFEKPYFDIQRNVPPAPVEVERTTRRIPVRR